MADRPYQERTKQARLYWFRQLVKIMLQAYALGSLRLQLHQYTVLAM